MALACAVSLTGCGNPVSRHLEGRWFGESVENFDDNEIPAATGWAKGMSMEFAGSTITVIVPAEEPRTGQYRIAKVDTRDAYLVIEQPTGKQDRVHFHLDSPDSIRWMLGEGRAIVLQRDL